MYTYPVYLRDSGAFVGNYTSQEIKDIGFKSDYYVIYFNQIRRGERCQL